MTEPTRLRYAVVTGGNKGIGLGICRELASKGVVVVLTARDEKKGLEAIEQLIKESASLSAHLVFQQLDVVDPLSITSLADFIQTKFGKLDILVNNAGIFGAIIDGDALAVSGIGKEGVKVNWSEIAAQTNELAEECLKTNYYGAKRMVEALVPLLQLSNSPRIVNVSSSIGQLKLSAPSSLDSATSSHAISLLLHRFPHAVVCVCHSPPIYCRAERNNIVNWLQHRWIPHAVPMRLHLDMIMMLRMPGLCQSPKRQHQVKVGVGYPPPLKHKPRVLAVDFYF